MLFRALLLTAVATLAACTTPLEISPTDEHDASVVDGDAPEDASWADAPADTRPDAEASDARAPDAPDTADATDTAATADAQEDAPAPRPPLERAFRMWHWNVAGGKIHRGKTTTGMIGAAINDLTNFGADFAGFNELCRSQFREIKRRLQARGWPQNPDHFARFAMLRPARHTPSGCGDAGVAIFSRLPLGGATRFVLPSDGSIERRVLLCAPWRQNPHLRFCTAHLTYRLREGYNRRQLHKMLEHLEHYNAQGHTVLLTGDLNTEPNANSMNRVYSSAVDTPHNRDNRGKYRELDDNDSNHCRGYGQATGQSRRGGECGNGRKIDYLFVRQNRIAWDGDPNRRDFWARVRNAPTTCGANRDEPCSDHRIVKGRVKVRIKR